MKTTPKQKIIRAWATINCRGQFCGAYHTEVEAKCEKEELDENWGEKGAKVVPVEIRLLKK